MKIAHFLPALTRGGAERVVVELANRFAAWSEVSVVAAYPVDSGLLQGELSPRVDLRFISRAPVGRSAYALALPWLRANWAWVMEHDIIHCHLTFGSALGSLVSLLSGARTMRPRVVETYHAVGMPMSRLRWRFHTALSASHDGFVTMASDPAIRQFLKSHSGLKHALIPNGIALPYPRASSQEREEYRERAGIPKGVPVVGTVGRLVPDRRPREFVKVFANIARERNDVHFLMAGEGPMQQAIGRFAAEAGFADRLHLPGLVLQPAAAYANIDLYLSLNVGDVTGIAALEAAATAVPIVAIQTDRSYNQRQGWIFSSWDPSAVADEALKLLESPDERSRLGRSQLDHVNQCHGLDAMEASYINFYESVLGRAA
jgi:glycosyltransferase involved in cell wall biosynthesis